MKTKDLIRLLILADPSGESEVCVGNIDIIDVDGPMPCYYDGQFVQVICDKTLCDDDNNHGVHKVITRTKGQKIKLRTMEAEEAFMENPDAILEMEPYNSKRDETWLSNVETWRKAGRELKLYMKELTGSL